MLSESAFIDLMDAIYEEDHLGDVHPCLGCPMSHLDPEYCRGCADFDMCPGLHPAPPKEPAYRALFRELIN